MRAQLVWGIYPSLVLAVGPNPRTEGAAGPFPRRGSRLQRGWKLTRDRAPHSCCSRALLRALGYGSFWVLQQQQRLLRSAGLPEELLAGSPSAEGCGGSSTGSCCCG